jgi:Holliday junction resolvase RusA-like endonuclease
MIDFFAPCIPPKTTAQQKRRSKEGNYFPSEKMEAAQATFAQILVQSGQRPAKPLSGYLALAVGRFEEGPKRERAHPVHD